MTTVQLPDTFPAQLLDHREFRHTSGVFSQCQNIHVEDITFCLFVGFCDAKASRLEADSFLLMICCFVSRASFGRSAFMTARLAKRGKQRIAVECDLIQWIVCAAKFRPFCCASVWEFYGKYPVLCWNQSMSCSYICVRCVCWHFSINFLVVTGQNFVG